MRDQDYEQFCGQGYFVAHGLIPNYAVEKVVGDVKQILQQQLTRLQCSACPRSSLPEFMTALYRADLDAYLASLKVCSKLCSLYELFLHPNIQLKTKAFGIAKPLFQTNPVFHVVSKLLAIPNGYHGFGAHQDWTALQSGLDTITIWVPFVDVDKDHYPMEVIPGSHLQGLLPGVEKEHIYEVDPQYYDAKQFVPIEAIPGDVVMMSNFTVHRSAREGKEDGVRVAASHRYENAAEHTFIERVYPYTQQRVIKREFIYKNFPSVAQVKGIYRP